MELVIATSNRGKYAELRELLSTPQIHFRSLCDFSDLPPAVEDGTTFAENARNKAGHYQRLLGLAVVADDSGLQVDFLNGKPGIHSARYAGPRADDKQNIEKLLRELRRLFAAGRPPPTLDTPLPSQSAPTGISSGLPQVPGYGLLSPARFVCVLTLFAHGREQFSARGICEGFIAAEPKGNHGFGYDPVFFVLSEGKTMAELPVAVKNRISHRSAAARELKNFLLKTASQPE